MMSKKGSILVGIIVILASLMTVGIAVTGSVLSTNLKLQKSHQITLAMNFAEAGLNKAVWELNQGRNYTGETNNSSLSTTKARGSFDVTVNTLSLNSLEVIATGYVPSKTNYSTKRTIKVRLSDKEVTEKKAFFYGIQLGTLGAKLENNSYIEGNVYSGGTLSGKNGSYVKGSVIMYNEGTNYGTVRDIHVKDPSNLNPPYIYNVWAHNIFNSTIYGDASYSCNTASCFSGNTVKGVLKPSSPPSTPMTANDWAIRDEDIALWKQVSEAGGVLSSFAGSYIDTKKVNGDMTVNGGTTTTLGGTVWVTGNLTIKNGATLQVDPQYGANSGLVIVDGQIYLENGAIAKGSGHTSSTLMLLSTKTNNSLSDPVPAIYASNLSRGSIYYAKNGFLYLNNNASAVSYAGKGLFLAQNSYFKFSKGIRNPNFTSGPGGRWEMKDWQVVY